MDIKKKNRITRCIAITGLIFSFSVIETKSAITITLIDQGVGNGVTVIYFGSLDVLNPSATFETSQQVGSYINHAGFSNAPFVSGETAPRIDKYVIDGVNLDVTTGFDTSFGGFSDDNHAAVGLPFGVSANFIDVPAGYVAGTIITGNFQSGNDLSSVTLGSSWVTNSGGNLELVFDTFNPSSTPEPSSALLVGLGIFGVTCRRRRTH